jgi:hypothetical protein
MFDTPGGGGNIAAIPILGIHFEKKGIISGGQLPHMIARLDQHRLTRLIDPGQIQ